MDLNYLYHRHGVSLIMAKAATSSCARIVHEKLAAAYAERMGSAFSAAERASCWTTPDAYQPVLSSTCPEPVAPDVPCLQI